MSADPRTDRPLPFRRRRFAAPHRRRRLALRLLGPFAGALLAVGAPAALGWWALTGPEFAIREIAVEGTRRVSDEWVRQRLQPLHGRHLLLLGLDAVEPRLEAEPWIRAVTVAKEPPSRLVVRVHEHRPAALLRSAGGLFYLDGEGGVIAPFDARGDASGLLVVSVAAGARLDLERALGLVEELERLRPEWAAGLSEIEVASDRDYRLYTEALPFALFVSRDRLAPAAQRLPPLVAEILRRYPGTGAVDARFTNQIVIQSAAPPLSLSEEG